MATDAPHIDPIQRAEEAQRLLANPIIADAFTAVREGVIRKFTGCEVADKETQYEAKRMLVALDNVHRAFVSFISIGKITKMKIEKGFPGSPDKQE